jgi:hypothetical protein
MNQFVLQRTDGKFVAVPGSEHSYTSDLMKARIFPSRAAAEGDRCVENEQIVPLENLLQVG